MHYASPDILMLGRSPIKWRQFPNITKDVEWDVNQEFKQTNNNPNKKLTRSRGHKTFSSSAQLSIKLKLLINIEIAKIS